jgi:hypothetical protein
VASAQRPIDEVDRPGSADPPEIVPKGTIQLESGIAFSRESGGSEPRKGTLTLPDLLIRIGVHERFELRLQADGLLYEFRDGAGDRALGSDLAVEAKVALFEQRTLVPETGILVRLSMPVGSDAATSGGFDPSLAGLFQWTLDERTAVVVNTSFAAPTQGHDDDRLFEFGPSVSLDRQITPRLGAFVEYFAAIKSSGAADEHSLGAGLTWFILAKRIQLDLSGGAGLSEAAPEWFVSAGLSLRFDAPWAD